MTRRALFALPLVGLLRPDPSTSLLGTIEIPSDGDPAVATDVQQALRELRENSIYYSEELGPLA